MDLRVVAGYKTRLILLICACLGVSGCAWYGALEGVYERRNAEANNHVLNPQDDYMQKYYELQRRIEKLEGKRGPKARTPNKAYFEFDKKAELAIQYIKLKTQQAIANIEGLIEQLTDNMSQPSPVFKAPKAEAYTSEDIPMKQSAVAVVLEHIEDSETIKLTTDGNRYKYSVVYVYQESQPWADMWHMLDKANINDKWRGKSQKKNTYFIYVGAYNVTQPAEKRRQNLFALTGQLPELRSRANYDDVVMN